VLKSSRLQPSAYASNPLALSAGTHAPVRLGREGRAALIAPINLGYLRGSFR